MIDPFRIDDAERLSDYDAINGTLRVSKACVAGKDKNCTKTGEDRIVTLCPRAICALARQLNLRKRLKAAGLIDHDHLFFTAGGSMIRHLQYVVRRWRQSLSRLSDIRYRRPYNARHSSVSWNPEEAPESEVTVIRQAMGLNDQPLPERTPVRAIAPVRVGTKK